jgi:hypothetical protein
MSVYGLLNLDKNIVGLLLSRHLDAKSAASLTSTCRRFREIGKQLVQCQLVIELRKFLHSHPCTRAAPFGGAGMTDVLSYLDAWMFQEALQLLGKENPRAEKEIRLLLWQYLLPARAWLNCRTFCNICIEWAGAMVQLEEMQLSTNWEPLPAVLFLLLSVVDFYLPRLLGRSNYSRCGGGLGLLTFYDGVDPTRPANIKDALRCGQELLINQGWGNNGAKLDVAMCSALRKVHPTRHFASAVVLIDSLYRQYEERYTEQCALNGNLPHTLYAGGFYESKADSRIHWLPVERLRLRLVDTTDAIDEVDSPLDILRKMVDPEFDSQTGSSVRVKLSRSERAKSKRAVVTKIERRFDTGGVQDPSSDLTDNEKQQTWKESLLTETEAQQQKAIRAVEALGEDEILLSFLYFEDGSPYVHSGCFTQAADYIHPSLLRFMLGGFGLIATYDIRRAQGW